MHHSRWRCIKYIDIPAVYFRLMQCMNATCMLELPSRNTCWRILGVLIPSCVSYESGWKGPVSTLLVRNGQIRRDAISGWSCLFAFYVKQHPVVVCLSSVSELFAPPLEFISVAEAVTKSFLINAARLGKPYAQCLPGRYLLAAVMCKPRGCISSARSLTRIHAVTHFKWFYFHVRCWLENNEI